MLVPQVGLGEADRSPADLPLVAAVNRVGEVPLQRDGMERAEHRFRGDGCRYGPYAQYRREQLADF